MINNRSLVFIFKAGPYKKTAFRRKLPDDQI